ncbi:MAG: ORF6N domain-containing protein [Bacteroidales bacterium]|nr:ORF6N domain-containing protein [Bacteroidales bacterium]MDD4575866.1 ORF6N domain-containing protein [Bacteroidales bacterium]
MSGLKNKSLVPEEVIINKIYLIRNQKVMIDRDLAELYGVETKVLKQAVKRNIDIFPEHFMFELTEDEFRILRSQFVTSSWGGQRYLPYVFTEHGILQLANILRSKRARQMSIRIIEVFVKMREMLVENLSLRLEIESIKKKLSNYDKSIELVFRYLDELLEKHENPEPRKQIGFRINKE